MSKDSDTKLYQGFLTSPAHIQGLKKWKKEKEKIILRMSLIKQ